MDRGKDRTGGERRQLTVLFCDVADSTGMSERCDPEDLRDILLEFQAICARSVVAWGGTVLNYIGDGIRAQFGYPLTSENDAERAVRAGLQLLDGIRRLSERAAESVGHPITVRIGIHTGFALIGKAAAGHVHDATEIVGDTPNIAARLQEIGPGNAIVISGETQRLLRGRFRLQELGPHSLRGLSRTFSVFQVLGEANAQEAHAARHPGTPLVNRAVELQQLSAAWARAEQGRGQVIALIGESGIGKSRLARELIARAALAESSVLALQGSESHQNVPFYPLLQFLEQKLGLRREQTQDDKVTRLQDYLAAASVPGEEPLWLFAQFLGLSLPVPQPLRGVDAEEQRRTVIKELAAILLRPPQEGAGLILIEDLHWADPSTREVVEQILAGIGAAPILLLITSRSDFQPRSAAVLQRLTLHRLEPEDCLSLVNQVAQGRELPSALMQRIVSRADGVPLFVEELATAAIETGGVDRAARREAAGDTGNVPAALYDPLMMRLDRLGEAKDIAQLAAVIGRSFSRPLLAALAGEDEAALDASLRRLAESGLIAARGEGGRQVYDFRHALVRDVAYYSLLRRERRELHGRLAQAIETRFPALAESEPDYLAQHLAAAGSTARAARLWLTAAKRAAARSANQEAVAQVRSALDHVVLMPEGAERDDLELEAQIALIGPEIARQGYAAPAVPQAIARARALCQNLHEDPRIFPVLYAQWSYNQVTGNMHASRQIAQDMLTLAERTRLRPALVVGHRALGTSLLLTGESEAAHAHLERAITLYDPQADRPMAVLYGSDVRVLGLCHFAIASWQMGEVARALGNAKMALDLAFELRHANTLGAAFTHACMLYALERDVPLVATWAQRGLAAATERKLPFWIMVASGFQGWCELQSGRPAEAVAIFEGLYEFFRSANLVYWKPTYLCWWAEACLRCGKLADARARLDEARSIMAAGGECWYESESWRIEGLICAREGALQAARDGLAHALDLARQRSQLGFVLRIAVDLARLMADDGEDEQARMLVSDALRPFRGEAEHGDRADAAEFLRRLDPGSRRAPERAAGG